MSSTKMVNIQGLDKAKVLKVLHDKSKAQGISFIHLEDLTLEDCEKIIKEYQQKYNHLSFDYLSGKVMKVDLAGDEFNPWGYDRDNGAGAAQRAIDSIK